MDIKFKIPQGAIAKLTESVKKSLTEIQERAAIKTYNYIVAVSDYPYWSGSYISNWDISVGKPGNTNPEVSNKPNTYAVPNIKLDLDQTVTFGQTIYISNYVPHAYQVEFLGTPTHPQDGWFPATHAVNQIILSHKFKM